MGQYYKPVILGNNRKSVKAWVYSHDITYTFKREDGVVVEVGHGLKLMEHSWLRNKFVSAFESLILKKPNRVVWAGDYADANTYDKCTDETKVIPKERPTLKETRYIINHTKKTFVDKTKVPSKDGWRMHPLPLLTADGNGRGGGDFRGVDKNNIIGSWAKDVISVDSKKPKEFTEFIFDLVE